MDIPVTKPISAAISASPVQVEKATPAVTVPEQAVASVDRPHGPPGRNLLRTQEAIAELVGRYLQTSTRNLEFQVDGDSATPVIIVRDGEGNVVRRIPGEDALQMLRLANAQSGTFVDFMA